MKFLLEGNCVKAFGKALHALSRIGDELWLDPMVRGLAVRAVNSAHSAYACFFFSPLFFQRYSLASVSEQGSDAIRCKLSMKSILPLFRCLTAIERNVQQCQISISSPPADRVTIQFFCRHGITKTHNLRFQDSEALQAVFSSHLCPNALKAPARLLADVVMQFPAFQDEVTLSMTPHGVGLRSHCEEGRGHMKATLTEMLLHPDEFDHFQAMQDSHVTFCLKELRGFLSFAESHCLPVWLHFGAAGKPVCFSVEDMLLEASVVLATLVHSGSRTPLAPPTPRCAADPLVAPSPVGSRGRQCAPVVMEVVPSSQGSPADPAGVIVLQPHTDVTHELLTSDKVCSSVSSTVCSLLFRAASSQLDSDGLNASLPALVCDSDEDGEEEASRGSPPLRGTDDFLSSTFPLM